MYLFLYGDAVYDFRGMSLSLTKFYWYNDFLVFFMELFRYDNFYFFVVW